jgi:hypothetical protein
MRPSEHFQRHLRRVALPGSRPRQARSFRWGKGRLLRLPSHDGCWEWLRRGARPRGGWWTEPSAQGCCCTQTRAIRVPQEHAVSQTLDGSDAQNVPCVASRAQNARSGTVMRASAETAVRCAWSSLFRACSTDPVPRRRARQSLGHRASVGRLSRDGSTPTFRRARPLPCTS